MHTSPLKPHPTSLSMQGHKSHAGIPYPHADPSYHTTPHCQPAHRVFTRATRAISTCPALPCPTLPPARPLPHAPIHPAPFRISYSNMNKLHDLEPGDLGTRSSRTPRCMTDGDACPSRCPRPKAPSDACASHGLLAPSVPRVWVGDVKGSLGDALARICGDGRRGCCMGGRWNVPSRWVPRLAQSVLYTL